MTKCIVFILAFLFAVTSYASQNLKDFKEIHKLSYLYRMQVVESYSYLNRVLSKGNILTGKDLRLINKSIKERVDLGKRGNALLRKLRPSVTNFKNNEKNYENLSLFLGTFLALSDSYFFAYEQFTRNFKLRRLLNDKNLSYNQRGGLFKKSLRNLYRFRTRSTFISAQKKFKNYGSVYSQNKRIAAVKKLILESFTYKERERIGFHDSPKAFFNFLKRKVDLFSTNAMYDLRHSTLKVLFEGSKVFGNTAGLFASRKGKLYNNDKFIQKTKNRLEPLDTILEKTPFRLTDKFIPGYWGHAGIYIGNKEQLKDLGIWNHETVKKFHKQIRAGRNIIEALRSGVEINSVKSFSNIDDFAIMRLNTVLTKEEKVDRILRALRQVGKDYDFGFDVETSSTIVCSELHYLTYVDVNFETEMIFGQPTISVDAVANQAINGGPFTPVALYLAGEEIEWNMEKTFKSLISGQDSIQKMMDSADRFQNFLVQ